MFYKYKKILKENTKCFLKHNIEKFDNFNQGKLSNKSIGELVRASHFSAPFSIIIMLMFCTKPICTLLVCYLVFISFAFLLFDGCFITYIEQKYCQDDFTIVDPCLEISNMEKTNWNRFLISIPMGLLYMTTAMFIFCIRFIDNSQTSTIGNKNELNNTTDIISNIIDILNKWKQ